MEDSKLVGTPMSTRHKLSKNDDSKEVDQTAYISMIGELQYVVHTRPDIVLEIGMVDRLSIDPKEHHMMAIKRIMRNMKGTKDYVFWHKKGGNFELKAFNDANWVGSVDDRKSTSDGVFFLSKRLVSWKRKKHN